MAKAGKVSKADAGYGPGLPHCGVCTHYVEEADDKAASCELVEGTIDEDMWCKLFKPKRKPTLAEGGM